MKIANALDRFTRQLAANPQERTFGGRAMHPQAAYRRDLEGLAGRVGNIWWAIRS